MARRDHVPHEVVDVARLSLGVRYAKPVATARFLAEAFGFGSVDDLPEEEHDPDVGYGYHWIELPTPRGTTGGSPRLRPHSADDSGLPTHMPTELSCWCASGSRHTLVMENLEQACV